MNALTEGRSLELYFIEGRPDGMLTAEVFNWTGHVLMTPRTRISAALSRKEARFTGVYILLGEQDGEPCAYIGEGEDISDRIRNHDTNKDWWTNAVLITSTANNLHKAHVKYLESRLVEEARLANSMKLLNGNSPTRSSLPEAATSNMETFLSYLLMVLPALRVDLFIKNTRPDMQATALQTAVTGPTFEFVMPNVRLSARAVLDEGDFVVKAGSTARLEWRGRTLDAGYAKLHGELKRLGVLAVEGDHCVFKQNYAFKSASAAAAVVCGQPANGPSAWKLTGSAITYREWEQRQLQQAVI